MKLDSDQKKSGLREVLTGMDYQPLADEIATQVIRLCLMRPLLAAGKAALSYKSELSWEKRNT